MASSHAPASSELISDSQLFIALSLEELRFSGNFIKTANSVNISLGQCDWICKEWLHNFNLICLIRPTDTLRTIPTIPNYL